MQTEMKPLDAAAMEKLAKFNAQFQRSCASPPQETPRLQLDGQAVLDKYIAGADAAAMSGAEFYAMIGTIKRQHGPKGESLEAELMKVTRQKDKKLRLAEWLGQHFAPAPTAMHEAPPKMPPSPARQALASMPGLNLTNTLNGAAAAAQPHHQPPPMTARPALAGNQMAELMGCPSPAGTPAPPLTARPSTAPAHQAAPVQNMHVVFQSYVSGRDHLKMSGAEYHSLIAWLRAHGHHELEDSLMKVRLLGDKKFHLVKYMKEKCTELLHPAVAPPQPPPAAPSVHIPALAIPQPVIMGGAQVAEIAPPQQMAPQQVAAAAPQPNLAQGISALEATISRLEESFAFAVECMQTDMAHAKEQLRQLRAAAGQA
jgi:hypothetical protein